MKLLEVETFNFRKKKGIKKGIKKHVFFYLTQIVLDKPKTCPCSLHEDPHVQFLGDTVGYLAGL